MGWVVSVIEALNKTALFSGVTSPALRIIAKGAHSISVPCGAHLFESGDEARSFFLLTSGIVRLYRAGLDGEDKVYQVLGEGDLIAETAMFSKPCVYPLSAQAESDCDLYRLHKEGLTELAANDSRFALYLLEQMSGRLYQAVNRFDQLTVANAGQRLVMYLLALIQEQKSHWLTLPVSVKVLAKQLNMSPETLSRLLARFRESDMISGRGRKWVVSDAAGLCQVTNLPLPDSMSSMAGSQFFRCCNFG